MKGQDAAPKGLVRVDRGDGTYRRFIQGDRSAFDEIMDAYRDKLIFFITGYVGNAETAQDIAMDTFVEILLHPGRFRFKSSFRTYLYSIARRKAADYIRHSREIPMEAEHFELPVSDLNSDIIRREDAGMLYSAMEKIPKDYKTAVYLIYFEDCSNDEAAKIMGKSKKQLANLVYRAKQALRAELEREGFCYEEQ